MSGISGILNLDGSPIDLRILRRANDAMAHRGPDAAGVWTCGHAGLAHRMLRTTPESLDEHQPLCDESGKVCLVLDGRVDNREELGTALEAKGFRRRNLTDAELVLKAYLCWGEETPARILGDFAFAIWDGRQNALFCARDVFGIKPFYYYDGGRFILIASDLRPFFQDPRVRKIANEGMVAEYLAGQITHCEETLWQGILRLPAAHFMWVKAGGLQKRRYWEFDLCQEIRYRTDDEYASHFLELLRESVRCRLRSCGPVGSYLSGGLDSSSVSVIANELLREQGCTEPLDTFSFVFPGMDCDESEHIQAAVGHAGLRSHLYPPDPPSLDYYFDQARVCQDFPGWPNGGAMMCRSFAKDVSESGMRVLLTGLGGNECVEGTRLHMTDLARQGKLLDLIRTAKMEAGAAGVPWPRLVWSYGVRRNIPSVVKRALAPLRRGRDRRGCLSPDLEERTQLAQRLRASVTPGGSLVLEDKLRSFYSGWSAHFHDSWDREADFLGIEYRHPFFDRRVAEFSFALPEQQRLHRGLVKVVLRNALCGRLPKMILDRRAQAEFTPTFRNAVGALEAASPFSYPEIIKRGWIIPAKLSSQIERFLAGESLNIWRLWAPIGLEIWCRET